MGDYERQRIVRRFRGLRRQLEIDFNTLAHWNEHVRQPGEEPIDPDPELRRLATAIDEFLANDPGHGPIAPLNFMRSQ